MDKVINRRPVTFVAAAFMLGIFLGGLTVKNLILTIAIPIALFAVGFMFIAGLKKALLCALYIAMSIGAVAFTVSHAINFDGTVNGDYSVTARVESVSENYITVGDISFDGESYKGKARVYGASGVRLGDTLEFNGTVGTLEWDIFDIYSSSLYNDKIYYEITADNLTVTGSKLKFFEKLKMRITEPIYKFMDDRDAGIAVSLLFGDKSGLNETDREIVNGIGLSHVFAVSGLHVGFLTALVIVVMNKLRVRPIVTLAVTVAALVVYGFLTGFPAGIKRAAVMSVIYMLAPFVRRKSDPLTALSAACCIILLTNPRELFDLSFIMSVSAVLGIIIFREPICRRLRRRKNSKLRKYVVGGVATTVSANVFLLPICFNVFNGVAVYTVVGNLLILPLVTVAYSTIAVSALFTAISPSMGFLYYLSQFPIILIRVLARFIYSLPFAKLSVGGMGAATACYLLGVILCSPLFKFNKKIKIIVAAILAVTGVLLAVFL